MPIIFEVFKFYFKATVVQIACGIRMAALKRFSLWLDSSMCPRQGNGFEKERKDEKWIRKKEELEHISTAPGYSNMTKYIATYTTQENSF